ncbi:MAG: hypothetical protein KA715_00275 [Xanthomonadaceae bacterium]|nr:hypothetical protein [Xanthomonadaceae bacterium]
MMRPMLECPRCDEFAYEKQETHSCCHACLYDEECAVENQTDPDRGAIPTWVVKAMREDEMQGKVTEETIIEEIELMKESA